MKKDLTEVVFILDKSGSMSGLESDTIGGFNSLIEKQKKEEGEALISVVLFNDQSNVIYDRVPIAKVEPMNDSQYFVGGCTALLDALGKTIKHINKVQKALPEGECPDRTMFIITTDGQENSSHEYSYEKIKKMIEKKRDKKKWEFLFLAANMDAISAAANMGIAADRAVRYRCDSVGTAVNYAVLNKTISKYRECDDEHLADVLTDWDTDIKKDYEARK